MKVSVTFLKVIVAVCALVTPVKYTVMVLPEKIGLPEMFPDARSYAGITTHDVIGKAKDQGMTSTTAAAANSTPGVPVSGRFTSKLPPPTWLFRETAFDDESNGLRTFPPDALSEGSGEQIIIIGARGFDIRYRAFRKSFY